MHWFSTLFIRTQNLDPYNKGQKKKND
jgi:hypothetical protein